MLSALQQDGSGKIRSFDWNNEKLDEFFFFDDIFKITAELQYVLNWYWSWAMLNEIQYKNDKGSTIELKNEFVRCAKPARQSYQFDLKQ